jgi:co-chaperonin GroES (HSP10)
MMAAHRTLENATELLLRQQERSLTIEEACKIRDLVVMYHANVLVFPLGQMQEGVTVKRAKRTDEAVVCAVGPGEYMPNGTFVPVEYKVGQRVLITRYGGTDVEVGEYQLKLLHSKQIYFGLRG